jgi:hypothetical protein
VSAKAKAAAAVAEETVEVIEETLDTLERIPKVRLNGTTRAQQILILATTAGVGVVVGGLVVKKLVEKRLTAKYDQILEHELAVARSFWQKNKPPIEEVAGVRLGNLEVMPEGVNEVAEAVQVLEGYQGKIPYDNPTEARRVILNPEPPEEVEVHNVFVEGQVMNPDDFDYDTELANRSEDAPYVISFEEFQQGEKDYQQITLNWYAGDDTLADSKDALPDVDAIVGEENMVRFGHGSKDPNIVYIRNDAMENDFEVVYNKADYASAVLGFQHSDRPGSRKTPRFRGDDG